MDIAKHRTWRPDGRQHLYRYAIQDSVAVVYPGRDKCWNLSFTPRFRPTFAPITQPYGTIVLDGRHGGVKIQSVRLTPLIIRWLMSGDVTWGRLSTETNQLYVIAYSQSNGSRHSSRCFSDGRTTVIDLTYRYVQPKHSDVGGANTSNINVLTDVQLLFCGLQTSNQISTYK